MIYAVYNNISINKRCNHNNISYSALQCCNFYKMNKQKMIDLCKQMVKFHSNSKSIFAEINKKIWEQKLNNLQSL